jgi:hypothetical protein
MTTKVVHCKKEPYDVYIGRPSKWGNPFTHIKDKKTLAEFVVKTRKESIDKYAEWILTQPELLEDLHELKDMRLGCFCAPKACHGHILAKLADELVDVKPEEEYNVPDKEQK